MYSSTFFFFTTFKIILFPFFAVSVTCLATSEHALLTVALGSSIQLNCTFNCSNGFTQGYWENRQDSLATPLRNGSVCVISLLLSSVSTKDLERNYTCRTENIEDENSLRKIQLVVSLQLQGKGSASRSSRTQYIVILSENPACFS